MNTREKDLRRAKALHSAIEMIKRIYPEMEKTKVEEVANRVVSQVLGKS